MERNEACFQAALEGAVLLKNGGSLPLHPGEKIALFGREQFEYMKSGSGSGGEVKPPYVTNVHDEIVGKVELDQEVSDFYADFIAKNPFDWATGWPAPTVQRQPFVDESLVERASKRNDKAIIVLNRVFGEAFDCRPEKGMWYLTDEEKDLFKKVCAHFEKVVVLLNIGNPMDLHFLDRYPQIDSVLLLWQGGMEGGRAAASLLMGEASPSGKLPITLAKDLEDYGHIGFGDGQKNVHTEDIYVGYRYFETFSPEAVRFPFGYGLSYSSFSRRLVKAKWGEDGLTAEVLVQNTGSFPAKEVASLYAEAPQGELGAPKRMLVAFQKSELLAPGGKQTLLLKAPIRAFARFDERDASPFAHSFYLEKGKYNIALGGDVHAAEVCFSFEVSAPRLVEKLSSALCPKEGFDVISPMGKRRIEAGKGTLPPAPKAIPFTGDEGYDFQDVRAGKCSLNDFIAQFKPEELLPLTVGEGWGSKKGSVPGSAAVYGGNVEPFASRKTEIVTCCDGPSGLRDGEERSHVSTPVAICVAASFNPDLWVGLSKTVSEDLHLAKVNCLLGPGANIMRHPFGGRNFEYFSEDPLLAGTMAASCVSAFDRNGIAACIKHCAVNSQELNRLFENEVLSERALREIYLIPFEMAVKSGHLHAIMTSYNRINGTSASSNAELFGEIVRKEWGYDGVVMTDWGCEMDDPNKKGDEAHKKTNQSARLRAEVDLYMIASDPALGAKDAFRGLKEGDLDPAYVQQAARHILASVLLLEGKK